MNRLETSFCVSMICESIGNRPLYSYDLSIDWTPAVVFLLDSHTFVYEKFKKKS